MRLERLRTAALCAALAALAVWLRALYRGLVLTPAGVLPFDGDSFYHFRRIGWTVRNFPDVLSVDPYVNFPHGGEPIWAPTFDFALAVVVRLVLGVGDDDAMERLLCWVPVLLGALHVVLLFLLGRRFLSRPAAVAAALLLAVLPAHFAYSRLGFVDHHVAVSLVGSLVLFAALRFAAEPSQRAALWIGLAFAGAFALWPGALIHVAVAQAALLGLCLSRSEPGDAVAVARRLAAAHAVAALAIAPLCLGRTWERWGSLSPLVLSNFQPLWLAAGALGFAALGAAWRRLGHPRGVFRRSALALAGAAAAAVAVLALAPGIAAAGAADAWAWLSRGEEFQAVVSESLPLLWLDGELRLRPAIVFLSGGILLAPLAVAVLCWRARAAQRPELGMLAAWGAAFVALSLVQKRFGVDGAPALALLLAAAADAGVAAAPPARRRLLATSAAVLGLTLCAPIAVYYALRPTVDGRAARRMALRVDAARWLRAHSPPTSGWLEPGPAPAYGVLGPWGFGHALRYGSQRPMVQDNFGDDVGSEGFDAAEAYFSAESEAAAVAILESLRVRYVLACPTGSGHGQDYGPGSLLARLLRHEREGAEEGEAAPVPLERHRLVYDAALEPGGTPVCRLFELAPAAPVAAPEAPS